MIESCVNLSVKTTRGEDHRMENRFTKHQEVLQDTKEIVTCFELVTDVGNAMGFLHNGVLVIHHINTCPMGKGGMKQIMNTLCSEFKTNKFRFTMIINPNFKNIVKGKVILIPTDAPDNPFGEILETIEGEWLVA
jgi:hypothetical protein